MNNEPYHQFRYRIEYKHGARNRRFYTISRDAWTSWLFCTEFMTREEAEDAAFELVTKHPDLIGEIQVGMYEVTENREL